VSEQREGGHGVRDRRAQRGQQRGRNADQEDQQYEHGTRARQNVTGRPTAGHPAGLEPARRHHQHPTPWVIPNSAQAVSCAFMVKLPKNVLMSGVVVTETETVTCLGLG